MFTGHSCQKIDDKGRFNFPSKYRGELGETFYIACWVEQCLIALPEDKMDQLYSTIYHPPGEPPVPGSGGSPKDGRNREMMLFLMPAANEVTPDKQGRILLSSELRNFAGIEGSVEVLGMGRHVELWNPDRWKARLAELQQKSSWDTLMNIEI